MGWDAAQGLSQGWLVLAGWSAVVVLWHSTVVALLFAGWRGAHREASPERVHAAALAALAIAFGLAVLTPALLVHRAALPPPPQEAGANASERADPVPPAGVPGRMVTAVDSAVVTAPEVRAVVSWLGLGWVVGCVGYVLRVVWGLAAVTWIRRRALPATSAEVVEAVNATCAAWQVRPPGVLTSSNIDVPVALGIRRPVVILPRNADAQLPAHALAPLIAHELAHVVRRDYTVNLVQSLADAALFFSPGARWISRCAREAREFCCDDLAVGRCGGPAPYARALMLVAHLGVTPHARLALGAAGPRLVVRIRRLLQEDSMARHPRRHLAAIAALLAVAAVGGRGLLAASVAGVVAVASGSPVAQLPPAIPNPPVRTEAPAIETTVPIPYPDEARAAGIQGPVVLSVATDALGQPVSVQAVAGDPLLTQAAVDAVGHWRFAPSEEPKSFILGVNVMPRDASRGATDAAGIRVGGAVKPPNKIVNVNPAYPVEAKEAGVQGVVILEARIGTDGIIDSAIVLRSVPGLDVAAATAVTQWQYTTTLLNGASVPVIMTVTVNFTLQ